MFNPFDFQNTMPFYREKAAYTCRNGQRPIPMRYAPGAKGCCNPTVDLPVASLSVSFLSHLTPGGSSACSLNTNSLTLHTKLEARDAHSHFLKTFQLE